MTSPWSRFSVGKPSIKSNWVEPTCRPLLHAFHIAHIREAQRILEDGRIRSGLVYDESCLKTKRTCVSWVSPNEWHDGSIYGNVQFSFDWNGLVKGRRTYWVEHRKTDKQRIVRFLLRKEIHDDDTLKHYDPSHGDGPLYHDKDQGCWYYHGQLTNEYMVLADLALEDCTGISFCDHHSSICKKKYETCAEKGLKATEAGATVLARLLGSGLTTWAPKFESARHPEQLDATVQNALATLCEKLAKAHSSGSGVALSEKKAKSLLASMCVAFGHDRKPRVKNLAIFFQSKKLLRETFWDYAKQFFKGLKVREE